MGSPASPFHYRNRYTDPARAAQLGTVRVGKWEAWYSEYCHLDMKHCFVFVHEDHAFPCATIKLHSLDVAGYHHGFSSEMDIYRVLQQRLLDAEEQHARDLQSLSDGRGRGYW